MKPAVKNKVINRAEPHWKAADKARAVAAYAATGSFTRAETVTGIPNNTIRYWAKQEWFSEELLRSRQADTDEMAATFTRIVKKATSELEDRLERGDEVITKEGEVILKKISAKEAAIVAAVAVDKRKVLIDQPAAVAPQSSAEKLLSLMEQFVKFSKAKEINHAEDSREISVTIEGEGVQQAEQLRHRDIDATEGGGPKEGVSPSNSEGGSKGEHDTGAKSQGPSL